MDGLRSATESALKKEHRATQMVAELTAIVREQKGRLAELSQARQETVRELRVRGGGKEGEGGGERGREEGGRRVGGGSGEGRGEGEGGQEDEGESITL